MSSALDIFDYCQTIGITVALFITIPLACFVYFKMVFIQPFSQNYTFKLIVLNGITVGFGNLREMKARNVQEIGNCLMYLFMYQLTTYPFMHGYYNFIQEAGFIKPLSINIFNFFDCLPSSFAISRS